MTQTSQSETRLKFQPFAIGKYEFLDLLGRGGMAEVYRVRLTGPQGFQKEFALKRVLPGFLTDSEVVAMFEGEARLTSMLNHANIVHVFEFIKSSGNYFLVMEYIHGKNLFAVLHDFRNRNEKFPQEMAIYIALKVCEGLDYAHNKRDPKTGVMLNIIHRDISPHNIMLSYEGGVKLVDFGIAKAMTNGNYTRTGTTKGKIAYMSPEQAMGKQLDARSDIFSMSVMLYELLVNKKLYQGESDLQILRNVQDCAISHVPETTEHLPPELQQILLKGLAPTPETRFQTIAEMQSLLQVYQSKHFPHMNQRHLADWLYQHFDPNRVDEQAINMEMTPLSISEENFMKDGFAKLEEAIYNSSSIEVAEEVAKPALPTPPPMKRLREATPEVREEKHQSRALLVAALAVVLIAVALGMKLTHRQETQIQTADNMQIRSPVAVAAIETPLSVPETEKKPQSEAKIQSLPTTDSEKAVADKEIESPVASPPIPVEEESKRAVTSLVQETARQAPMEVPSNRELPKKVAKPNKEMKTVNRRVAQIPPRPAKPEAKSPVATSRGTSDFDRLGAALEANSPESGSLKAKRLYDQGMTDYKKKNYEGALTHFHESRSLKANYLPAWFYEIKSLEMLNRTSEAKAVATSLVLALPDAKNSPIVAPYLKK